MTDTELDALDRKLAGRLETEPRWPEDAAPLSAGGCWLYHVGAPDHKLPNRFSRDLNAAYLLGKRLKEMGLYYAYTIQVIQLLAGGDEAISLAALVLDTNAKIRAQAALAVLEAQDGLR